MEAVIWQQFPKATSSTCRAQPAIQAQVVARMTKRMVEFTSDKPKTWFEAMCLTPLSPCSSPVPLLHLEKSCNVTNQGSSCCTFACLPCRTFTCPPWKFLLYVIACRAMYVTKHEAWLVQDKFEFYSALQLELERPLVRLHVSEKAQEELCHPYSYHRASTHCSWSYCQLER